MDEDDPPATLQSTISVVGHRTGFQFQGVDSLPLLPDTDSAASRLSIIRRKHLSHIEALRDDGFDFLPPDAHLRLLSG